MRLVGFGPFEIDVRAGELRKQGRRIRLQDQPLQVLAELLAHPGEMVTRDELRQKLWPADTFVDFDHGLNNAINRLREALGDSADHPTYIETIPRRGYRFIGTIERAAGVVPEASPAEARPIRSIAVLPLETVTGDPEYLGDALTDGVTTELAQLGALRVISRMSAMRYKTRQTPLPEIARELNVDTVVTGTVRRRGRQVRVTTELIDAATERRLGGGAYEREVETLPALQSEIARDVAGQLGIELTGEERARFSRHQSVNPEALDHYLRAQSHFGLRRREDNQAAIRLLEKAIALDPSFATAHAALSAAYRVRGLTLEPDETEWEEKAFAAVQKALQLDANLAEAYAARGFLLWSRTNHFPHARAVRELRRALALNPNLAEAHHQLGNVYNHVGLLDKAADEIQTAVALDPFNTGARFRAGINLLYQCRYEESLVAFGDARRFSPSLWAFQTSFALFQLGRPAEAKERVSRTLREDPRDEGGLLASLQALLAAAAGNARETEAWVRKALTKEGGYQHFHHTLYVVGSAYARLNAPEPAATYLARAADDGFPCYPLFERDANLDNLRRQPRFRELLGTLKAQWEHFTATL